MHVNMVPFQKWMGVVKKRSSDEYLGEILREAAIEMYMEIADNTPQYSGYLVSNLRVGVDGDHAPHATDLLDSHNNWKSLGEFDIKQKGDDYAIGIAATYNRGFNAAKIRKESIVSVMFRAPHWFLVEQGTSLRDVNRPGHMIETTKAKYRGKFNITWTQGYKPKGTFI